MIFNPKTVIQRGLTFLTVTYDLWVNVYDSDSERLYWRENAKMLYYQEFLSHTNLKHSSPTFDLRGE